MGQSRFRYKRFTFEERLLIQRMWNMRGLSMSAIARYLERSVAAVRKELMRGNVLSFEGLTPGQLRAIRPHGRIKYSAEYADQFVVRNSIIRETTNSLNADIKRLIEYYLNYMGWSPEKIVKEVDEVTVSANTIRNYIRDGLIVDLRKVPDVAKFEAISPHIDFNREDGLSSDEVVLKHMPGVNTDNVFGYWHVTLVKSQDRLDRAMALCFVERKTRFVVLIKLPNGGENALVRAFDYFLQNFGATVELIDVMQYEAIEFTYEHVLMLIRRKYNLDLVVSFVTDGSTMSDDLVRWLDNTMEVGLSSYTSLRLVNQDDLNLVSDQLNERPFFGRKKYSTPESLFDEESKLRYLKRVGLNNHE
ncbi:MULTISPECIES: helix-turn-helix domain-containing protein [Weissella]|uniref:Helix-turn-helix domain-containing protein n=1 Tax=Weissella fermenti TaxID=2987699 RepID=A0ABT6D851_9LACO|nr:MULTISPECIES: helix-turn-helix domain-containing protein [Weissella]MCW0927873.1 helix-turn-helix domain-containing protein [Weissella sp. LMG 11983]MDF9300828.1 helix-turn-helix domain-containing protein [Weissella sp. BK2]